MKYQSGSVCLTVFLHFLPCIEEVLEMNKTSCSSWQPDKHTHRTHKNLSLSTPLSPFHLLLISSVFFLFCNQLHIFAPSVTQMWKPFHAVPVCTVVVLCYEKTWSISRELTHDSKSVSSLLLISSVFPHLSVLNILFCVWALVSVKRIVLTLWYKTLI